MFFYFIYHLLGELNGGLAAHRPAAALLGILGHICLVLVAAADKKAIVINIFVESQVLR